MSGPGKPPARPPRDPFGPPLDASQAREVFRRLAQRSPAEQADFVGRLNMHLVDPLTEQHLFGWLAAALLSPDAERQAHALETLEKLPHFRRTRHLSRFGPLLDRLTPEVARDVRRVFGPVLGGPPRRPQARRPAAPAAPPVNKEASDTDLARLKDFFGKFGGAPQAEPRK